MKNSRLTFFVSPEKTGGPFRPRLTRSLNKKHFPIPEEHHSPPLKHNPRASFKLEHCPSVRHNHYSSARHNHYSSVKHKQSPSIKQSFCPPFKQNQRSSFVQLSPPKNAILTKIRNRRQNSIPTSPQEVLSNSILPSISSSFLSSSPVSTTCRSSLSYTIQSQLQSLKDQLSSVLDSQDTLDRQISTIRDSIEKYKKCLSDARSLNNNFLNAHTFSSCYFFEQHFPFTSVKTQFFTEIQIKARLEAQVSQLRQSKFLLLMKNQITADQLWGILKINNSLFGAASIRKVLTDWISQIFEHSSSLASQIEDCFSKCSLLHIENTVAISYNKEIADFRVSAKTSLASISSHFNDLTKRYKHQMHLLKYNITEKDLTYQRSNQKICKLTGNYEKLKVTFNSINMKNSERICIRCKRLFKENENMHWSCIFHLSDWDGLAYWCCGKTSIDDVGCMKSKHTVEDSSKKIEEIKECSSCRETGHSLKECPRDPNIRGGDVIGDEIRRIELMKKRGLKARQRIFKRVANKYNSNEDNNENDRCSEEDEEDEEFEEVKEHIRHIRRFSAELESLL